MGVGRGALFLNLNPTEGGKRKNIQNWQFWSELDSHLYQHEPQELCAKQGIMSPARTKADLFTAVLFRLLQLTTAKWELSALSTTCYLFLAMTFHSRPWLGMAVSMSTMRFTCYRRRYVFPPAPRCGKTISPVCKFYAKSTDDRHHQTQCLYFLQDSSQGRQSKQDFLWVLVWLKNFYMYFYTKKTQPEHFPAHLRLHRSCPFPRLSLLECCSHGCIQHKACSRLRPDQSSRDNQVRWSNGP